MQYLNPMMTSLLASALILAAGCSDSRPSSAADSQGATVTGTVPSSDDNAIARKKPYLEFTNERSVSALVSAIDHDTREITLTAEDGGTAELTVSEEVRNLDQVSKGDRVSVYLVEDLIIEVLDGEGVTAGEAMVSGVERAEEGEMPGMIANATEAVVYKVEAIDREAGTYTLSDVNGYQQTFTAQDPSYLEQAEVGDVVMVSLTRAVAAEVEKLSGE